MLTLAAIGIVLILAGLIIGSQRLDDYWRDRQRISKMTSPTKLPYRPFRTSPDQCVDCGRDDGPLSIDDGRCIWCFELKGERHG